jgi:hypothetical protein
MSEQVIATHDIQWRIGSNGLAMPVLVGRPTERFPQSGRLFVSGNHVIPPLRPYFIR